MHKKLISLVLVIMLTISTMTIGGVSAFALTDSDGSYIPSTTHTNRYYFYMPQSWKNDVANLGKAGVYWWNGTDACDYAHNNTGTPNWPGYNAHQTKENPNIFYIDCPQDVATIIWNNYLDGGEDSSNPNYDKAKQTININTEYYDKGESDLYPEGTESFNNMIYVIDSYKTQHNDFGKANYNIGEWYYYYGNGEYGITPTKSTLVFNGDELSYTSLKRTFNLDVKSLGWNSTNKVYCHIYSTIDDDNIWTDWQSKAEFCDYNTTTGIATYDINTAIDKGYEMNITNSDSCKVIFSNDKGDETQPITINKYCFSDTLCATGNNQNSSSVDNEKKVVSVKWNNYDETTAQSYSTFKLDVQSLGWNDSNSIYCHIYNALDPSEICPQWQTKAEYCDYNKETGIATYDLKTAIAENYNINIPLAKKYCIIFSNDKGNSTTPIIVNSPCFGDTLSLYENIYNTQAPVDDPKVPTDVRWIHNYFDAGVPKYISADGQIYGYDYLDGQSDSNILADYLVEYYNTIQTSTLQKIIYTLKVTRNNTVEAVETKLDKMIIANQISTEQAKTIKTNITNLLNECVFFVDVNLDGKTTIDDATLIQKYLSGRTTLNTVQLNSADADNNGKININDATLIQKLIAERY